MTGRTDGTVRTSGEHILFNVIYNHLPAENVHALHKGNVSVVWTRFPVEGADLCLYLDSYSYTGIKGSFDILLLNEPIVVQPGQYDPEVWGHFDHVITQYDTFVKNNGFTKNVSPRAGFRTTEMTPETAVTEDQKERERIYPLDGRIKGICMINGNKQSTVPGELYSKRIEAALWFTTHSDTPFDTYGTPPFFLRNYRGIVPRGKRLETMKRYRFAIAFENVGHETFALGYIDKMLDCLETRTVPIYLGAPNAADYIPEGCFIDFRRFADYGELDRHLKHMDEAEYREYVRNIDLYVTKGGLRPCSWHTIYDQLLELFAVRTGRPGAEICGDPSSGWAPGLSPARGTQEIKEQASTAMWTFAGMASKHSPLMDYDNAAPRPGGTLPNGERLERILALRRQGKSAEAVEEFAYMGGGGNMELQYLFASLLLDVNNLDAAAVYLDLILAANDRHSRALNDRGAIHLSRGEIRQAVELFHKAIASDNTNYDAVENLVTVLTRLNVRDHAASVLADLMEALPGDDRIAAIAREHGLETGGADTPKTADTPLEPPLSPPEEDPGDLYDTVVKIVSLKDAKRFDEALREVEHLLAREKDSADIHYLRAQVLNAKGDADEAAGELLRSVELDSRHSNAYNDLGCHWARKGEHSRAFDSFVAAITSNPANYGATGNFIRFLLNLRSEGEDIDPVRTVKKVFFDGIRDIGMPRLPDGSKRALVINRDEAIPWYLSGLLDHFPLLTREAAWWESAEIVRLLNLHGYIVDCVGPDNDEALDQTDFGTYRLIIDGGTNNLVRSNTMKDQRKVLYSSGEYWLNDGMNELSHVMRFALRQGIIMPADGRQRSNFSDEKAQYLTYFGNDSQLKGFGGTWKAVPLDASACFMPGERTKDLEGARGNYIWSGTGGMLRMGLDLVVEAFARVPGATLHVFAPLENQTRFFDWFKTMTRDRSNIIHHPFDGSASDDFEETAWNCIGCVFAGQTGSAPGFMARHLSFGLIPVVTRSSCVREETIGFVVDADDDEEIIEGIVRHIRAMNAAPLEELEARSGQARRFALEHHTREAFTRSFEHLIAAVEG